MAQVRALALHTPLNGNENVTESITKIVDKISECLSICGMKPWTLRLILPPATDCRDLYRLSQDLFNVLDDDIMVGLGIEEHRECINSIVPLLTTYPKLYMSTRCDNDMCIEKVVDSVYLRRSIDIDYNVYTRFALIFGTWIETPYFPATCNFSNVHGLSISLMYVDLVEKALFNNNVLELFRFIEESNGKAMCLSKCSDVPFIGVDLSLSPWMDESVAGLIEKLIRNRIGHPGTINAIYSLNKLINRIIERLKLRSIGFNEVMLPVAEDSILNERIKNSDIRLRDLINYSLVCVAGLDMVAIPINANIYSIAIDMLTVHKIKRRNVAMRVIPVDQNPTAPVNLKMFGTTYVAMI
ncbi:MAG: DUF711 family protein [Ignisphaera sp.]|uniref:DUF711 family protein n=1 Tax=Ignisphaera aggregans TaxID=334771 RepID=A0A7J3MZ89_9CREN